MFESSIKNESSTTIDEQLDWLLEFELELLSLNELSEESSS